MIQAQGLSKSFGPRTALRSLSFEIPAGQVVGFLGPNGAGKTTAMRLLTGYLRPDSGRAQLAGFDPSLDRLSLLRRVGYLPEDNPLHDSLEVCDLLRHSARLRGFSAGQAERRLREVLRSCGLKPAIGRRVAELSKGFRQRVGLAQAILHDPPVLILDEPTSGLDPNQIEEVRALILELKREKTVLLSTHILSEATAVCDRVLILHEGAIAADGAPAELSGRLQGGERLLVELRAPAEQAEAALRELAPGAVLAAAACEGGAAFSLSAPAGRDLREPLCALAARRGWTILSLRRESLSLEQIFRELTRP